jgi:hypothetical protein
MPTTITLQRIPQDFGRHKTIDQSRSTEAKFKKTKLRLRFFDLPN